MAKHIKMFPQFFKHCALYIDLCKTFSSNHIVIHKDLTKNWIHFVIISLFYILPTSTNRCITFLSVSSSFWNTATVSAYFSLVGKGHLDNACWNYEKRQLIHLLRYTWSLYFSNAGFTGSASSSMDGSLIKRFSSNGKFFAILQKHILNVFGISSLLNKFTLLWIKFIVP